MDITSKIMTFTNSKIVLGKLCIKYLKLEQDIELEDLVISGNISQTSSKCIAKYNGEPVTIHVVTDIHNGRNHSILSFCSDDIPELHLPVRINFTDKPDIQRAYVDYMNTRDEVLYHDNDRLAIEGWTHELLKDKLIGDILMLKVVYNISTDPVRNESISTLRSKFKALLLDVEKSDESQLAENVARYVSIKGGTNE